MLARPEIDSKEDILLFLASKPAAEFYPYPDCINCACGQYSRDRHGLSSAWMTSLGGSPSRMLELNKLAAHLPWTFGALYERARKAWDV